MMIVPPCLLFMKTLFLQFIKDCAYDANASESSAEATIPGTKPDISLRYVLI